MNNQHDIGELFLTAPPKFEVERVARAVKRQFGLAGDYTELVSERDQNFRLQTEHDGSFVVKATSLTEEAVVTEFQIAALIHLENRGISGVPRIVRTTTGEDHASITADDGNSICLRIVTWLSGRLLSDFDVTPVIAQRFGTRLAELDLALEGFSHAGESQVLLWDTQRAGELRNLLVHVEDSAVRECLEDVLDSFDANVSPVLQDLPQQVIHNDANDDNILLDSDEDVCGIIDFGDMLKAPRVIDVSTAASYLRTSGDPLRLIEPFVAAYHRKSGLLEAEFEHLFDLTRTRLAMTLIILYWRLSARDENDPYRQKALTVNSDALEFLQNLSRLGRQMFADRIFKKII
jgi:Ser/Thr protein kinase RdoA (MazF antagonist)